MIANRIKRKYLLNRKPLHEMHSGPGWLWDRNEVGEARKRVAAKCFIRNNSNINPADIRDLPTKILVALCKGIKHGRKNSQSCNNS